VETDKATVDYEVNEEGFLAKILKPNGSKDIPLGEVLCIVVDDKNLVSKFSNYSGSSESGSSAGSEPVAPTKAPTPQPKAQGFPKHTKLKMPNLSPTMTKVI
jgi:pyruvate dehydrogenase E2 component (dihydrolipoamide acetyltransferase)